ncbi:TonB-dependent receptor [Phenylobacterium sp.]|uniref:TonB-dependent receptor plug domain-containing protein n=1 Tax=Phenylobacterium sp. TaxID=1871053 RepID=UPI00120FEC4F|nr:TonB-dependent receptor [Phenylobacterium sp.]THD67109.1 MAG: TonB-dependent receptor [Phenylobacterium sp.]
MLLFILAQAAAAAVVPAQAPGPAVAQTAAPAQPAIVSYAPDFFKSISPNTALDMVNALPGFALDTGSGVRGYEGAAGNVLIDGQRPATKTEGVDSVLQRMLATHVSRIDVIRGGAPGIDMQGKTVIANVITKQEIGARGIFHYADQHVSDGRRFGTLRIEGSGKVGDRTWEGGVTVSGFIDDGFGDGPRTVTNGDGTPNGAAHIHSQGWGTQSIVTGATEAPLAGGSLRINGRIGSQAYDTAELDTFSFPNTHTEHDHQDDNYLQSEIGARYTHGFGARTTTEFVVLRQDKHELYADAFDTPTDAQEFRQDTTTSETILRGVVKFQQNPSLSWEAGAEGAYNTLENHILFSDNAVFTTLPAADVEVDEKRGETFGKAVWRPFSTLTVEGAVREEGSNIASSGDVNLSKTLYYTKPRLAVTWAPDADNQFRFRYEREVGQLDFGAFVASTTLTAGVVTAGNPNLVPQQDWASEIAYERRFWGGGGLVLTARHLEITDVVDRAPLRAPDGTFFDAPANIGAGSENDFLATLTVPLDKLGLKGAVIRGDYTRRVSEVTDPTTHERRPISNQHPSDWDAHYSQTIGKVIYGVDLYGGWQQRNYRFNQIEIDKLQTYVTPYAEWKPNPKLTWRVELDNVTARGFKHTFENWDGPRNLVPLDTVDLRSVHPGRVIYIRLRKTFGD